MSWTAQEKLTEIFFSPPPPFLPSFLGGRFFPPAKYRISIPRVKFFSLWSKTESKNAKRERASKLGGEFLIYKKLRFLLLLKIQTTKGKKSLFLLFLFLFLFLFFFGIFCCSRFFVAIEGRGGGGEGGGGGSGRERGWLVGWFFIGFCLLFA